MNSMRNFAQKHQLEAVLYFLPFSLVAFTFFGWWMGGYWTFSTPIFVYLVINIMDHVIPKLSEFLRPVKRASKDRGGGKPLPACNMVVAACSGGLYSLVFMGKLICFYQLSKFSV